MPLFCVSDNVLKATGANSSMLGIALWGGTSESALTGKRRNMDMKSQKTNVQDWVFSVSAVFLNMEVQS